MARKTNTAIIAAFRSAREAQAASADLQAAGIPNSDIYIEGAPGEKSPAGTNTSSTQSGIGGWFKSIFSSEEHPDRTQYEGAIGQGHTLLRVDLREEEISNVEDILNQHSPIDIHAEEDERIEAASGHSQTAASETGRAGAHTGQSKTVPIVKEDIQIGKRRVLRGGVRLYSRMVEEPVQENVRLREEHVRVERQPVNRAATDADLAAGREQVIEVQEFAEEPVVSKQARVVEEVRVGKDVSERTETVRDAVRHTDVDVEQTGGTQTGSAEEAAFDDSDFRSDFQNRYAATGASYDIYLPAYRYGYDMAADTRFKGQSFDEVEPNLREDYGQRYPNGSWDRMKDAIRYGWNRVTGKTKAAAG